MKGYPVTKDELYTLGGAGFIATLCFSGGANYLNRSFEIQKSLELAQGVPPQALIEKWKARESDAFTFGLALCAIGAVLVLFGGAKIFGIIKQTEHPTENG